jgi:serine protease AprX
VRRFAVLATLLLPIVALSAPTAGRAAVPLPPLPPVAHADVDGDHISDDFENVLAGLASSAPVQAVVQGSLSFAGAQTAVGPLTLLRQYSLAPAFAATMTVGQARSLAAQPGVLRVEANSQAHLVMDASKRDFGVDQARADLPGTDGTGIGICFVDSGVDPLHEQLDNGKVAGFIDVTTTPNGTVANDPVGHGTHVASIAAGDGVPLVAGTEGARLGGVAPGAKVYMAKAFDAAGNGSTDWILQGMQWCAGQPAQVVSFSIGASTTADASDGHDALSMAANNLVTSAHKIVMAAAGNAGDGLSTIGTPGAARQAITVGAVGAWSAPVTAPNHAEGVYLAPFSSRGPILDPDGARMKPEIVAPGLNVRAAQVGVPAGYAQKDGTSMATPFTAGAVALALQRNPALTRDGIVAILHDTGQDRGLAGLDNDWGYGLLDVHALVAAAGGTAGYAPHAFPTTTHITGTVPDHGAQAYAVSVTDTTVPVAATLISTAGSPNGFWTPHFDLQLTDPSGIVIASHACPLPPATDCGLAAREESLHAMPLVTGTYTLTVTPSNDIFNNGTGGAYVLDVSTGPVVAAAVPDHAPIANAGPAQTVATAPGVSTAAVALDGSGSSDADSQFLSYRWTEGATAIASGRQPTVNMAPGRHQIGLTVTDGQGAPSPTAAVIVQVGRAALPAAVVVQTGSLTSGSVASLSAQDSSFLQLASTKGKNATSAWYGSFTGLPAATALRVTYAGLNSAACAQTVDIWRWNTSAWVNLATATVGATETRFADRSPPGAPALYLQRGQARVRVRCTTSSAFAAKGDLLTLTTFTA